MHAVLRSVQPFRSLAQLMVSLMVAAFFLSATAQAQVLTLDETKHVFGGERKTPGIHYSGAGRIPSAHSDSVTALIFHNYYPEDETGGMFMALVSREGSPIREPIRLTTPEYLSSSSYQHADIGWDGLNFIVLTKGPETDLLLKRYTEDGEWVSDTPLNISAERYDGIFMHVEGSRIDLLHRQSDGQIDLYTLNATNGEVLSRATRPGAAGGITAATTTDDGWAYMTWDSNSVRIHIASADALTRGNYSIESPDFIYPGQAIEWNGETLVAISYYNDDNKISIRSYELGTNGDPVRDAVTLQHIPPERPHNSVNFSATLNRIDNDTFLAVWDTGSELSSVFEYLQGMVLDAHGLPLSNQLQLTEEPLDQMDHAAAIVGGELTAYSIEKGSYEPSIVQYRLAYDAQQTAYTPTPTPTPTSTPTPTATPTPTQLGENVHQLTIRTYIDGVDRLHIRDGRLWYVHERSAKPGLHDGNNFPTTVNGEEWFPRWRSNDSSYSYLGLEPAPPAEDGYFYHLAVNQGRSSAVIVQEPREENGYELIVLFDDDAGTADWYDVTLLWGPEPFEELPAPPDAPYLIWRGSLSGVFRGEGLLEIRGDEIQTISDTRSYFFTRSYTFSEPLPETSVELEYEIHKGSVEFAIAEQPRPWNNYTAKIAMEGDRRGNSHDVLIYFTWREVEPEPSATPWPTWNPSQPSPTPVEGIPKVLWVTMPSALSTGTMWNFLLFRDMFTEAGAECEQIIAGSQPITPELLAGYQAIVFGDTRELGPVGEEESQAVVDFVRNGGSIFILGQQDSDVILEDPSRYATSIAQPFGVTYGLQVSGSAQNLVNHPLMHRVERINGGGSRLTVEAPAVPLATNNDGEVLFAIAEDGYGRVAAYGDEMMFFSHDLDENGFNTVNNRRLASNLVNWLLRLDERIIPTPTPTFTPRPTNTPDPDAPPTPTLVGIDLLEIYGADVAPEGIVDSADALEWTYTPDDFYFVSSFTFEYGNNFKLESGPADLGVGVSEKGVVWAVLIPHHPATLHSSRSTEPEAVESIHIRMHPATINQLFPPGTVFEQPEKQNAVLATHINQHKFRNSWHAGMRAFVPPEGTFNFDIDLTNETRRFFYTDRNDMRYVQSLESSPVPKPMAVAADDALEIFDEVWDAYDRDYAMFVLRPEVDWNALRGEYRPKASEATTNLQIAGILADMLRPLRDLHIWVRLNDAYMPVYSDNVNTNANRDAYESLIGTIESFEPFVDWGVTSDNIGFLAIHSWSYDAILSHIDDAIEQMKETDAMIVDVRFNGGGSEPLAQNVAGRFADQPYVYAYSQYRNGPGHEDLTDFFPRSFEPTGAWRYDKPVIVLIGPRCMSSNESFVKMMDMCPSVTLLGDNTRGSSGNPMLIELGFGLNVSVPRWIDYRTDKVPLDEEGIPPDIRFEPNEDSFTGDSDELLQTALNHLRQTPVTEWMLH